MIDTKTRDFRIDLLKFLAVFLIINSHSDIAYPKFSMLATGGAIGDCLFLFCSGFTLLLGGVKRFDLYYKRRVNRIYPSVFASVAIYIGKSDNKRSLGRRICHCHYDVLCSIMADSKVLSQQNTACVGGGDDSDIDSLLVLSLQI